MSCWIKKRFLAEYTGPLLWQQPYIFLSSHSWSSLSFTSLRLPSNILSSYVAKATKSITVALEKFGSPPSNVLIVCCPALGSNICFQLPVTQFRSRMTEMSLLIHLRCSEASLDKSAVTLHTTAMCAVPNNKQKIILVSCFCQTMPTLDKLCPVGRET